jgi:hypothetical protein
MGRSSRSAPTAAKRLVIEKKASPAPTVSTTLLVKAGTEQTNLLFLKA